MFDDTQRLRDNPGLLELLSLYADLGKPDRMVWQDRLALEGLEGKELSKLHGDLIAFDWIEQNTGMATVVKPGVVSSCYRVTPTGIRDLARLRGEKIEEKPAEVTEKSVPKFTRKRKPKGDAVPALEVSASEA